MSRVAAIFDVDGTLVRANALHYYLYFLRHARDPRRRLAGFAALPALAPWWLALDLADRARFNRSFYRCYRGWPMDECRDLAEACFRAVILPRLIPETVARAEAHRRRGDRILIVSGTLDVILAPLARHLGAEAVLATRLGEAGGRCTGVIAGPNMVGPVKATAVDAYARAHDIDLAASHAYADSLSDAALLATVGHPVAVDPGRRLRARAERDGWEIMATARRRG